MQESNLCHMSATLKLHSCKYNVEWRVGQAPVRKQFFLYQFQGTVPFVGQEIGFLQFVPIVRYDVQIFWVKDGEMDGRVQETNFF